ncbi:MAG: carbohydrate binding family 9 domain-containing protein [Gemmatimonadetes bacterium]|nr:carbohydrate binding family 9 domain-containing protein [Gemmatimonadota bacterium]
MPLTRLSGPIVLDGVIDEPAWQQVPPLPMTVYTPTYQGPFTERTEILVAYDDDYLYMAGRLYDSDPAGVRANTLYRDQYSGDDVLAIVIDSYNDNETALWFATSPPGVRSDRSVANDAQFGGGVPFGPGGPVNSDWNTFWDVATVQNDEGWFAEMRIPFSSLRFQDVDGHVVMGIITYRFIARKNERHVFPSIPPNWGMGFAKPSQARRVSLEGVRSQKPVYFTPYALGGVSRVAELNGAQTAYASDNDVTNEVGLDVKYSVTSNLVLDLTANTDFAQVEADSQQLNLTRFSLFFPEKRQFFQERGSIFEFSTGGLSRLFHSRQIGLNEGEPVRLLGGARLVGRIGKTDLGFLNMQTASTATFDAENFGVIRVRRQVFNRFSNVGGIATTRIGGGGSYNVAVGADALIRPFGDEYVTVKWAETFEDGRPGGTGLLDASRVVARWERRNEDGFSYNADFIRSGADYNPGVGFAIRQDFTFGGGTLQYKRFQGPQSPFRSIEVQNVGDVYVSNADRRVESASIQPSVRFEMKTGANINIQVKNSYESVREAFQLSGGPEIPIGDYWFHEGQVRLESPRGGLFRPNATMAAGTFYDGWRVFLQGGAAWNPSLHLELGGNYQLNVIRFSDRNESLNAHVVAFRIQTALDVHLSFSTLLQYNSTADDVDLNSRLRYNFREGNDLWLVYNEGFNTDRDGLTGPRRPFSQRRTLMVKYTHTFLP